MSLTKLYRYSSVSFEQFIKEYEKVKGEINENIVIKNSLNNSIYEITLMFINEKNVVNFFKILINHEKLSLELIDKKIITDEKFILDLSINFQNFELFEMTNKKINVDIDYVVKIKNFEFFKVFIDKYELGSSKINFLLENFIILHKYEFINLIAEKYSISNDHIFSFVKNNLGSKYITAKFIEYYVDFNNLKTLCEMNYFHLDYEKFEILIKKFKQFF